MKTSSNALDGIETVPWPEISHAYGRCEQVPELLQNLAEGNEKAVSTLGFLDGCCFHQGTHYEANAHILPFLLRITLAEECVLRPQLLDLLLQWFAESDTLRPPKAPRQQQAHVAALDQELFQYGLRASDQWLNYKRQTMGAAWSSRQLLVDAVAFHADPQVSAVSAVLLSELVSFGQHFGCDYADDRQTEWFETKQVAAIANDLAKAALSERHPAVSVSCLLSLGAMRDDAEAIRLLEQAWEQVNDPRAKTAAAAACLVAIQHAEPAVFEMFCDGFLEDYLNDESMRVVPWLINPESNGPFADQMHQQLLTWLAACPHPRDEWVAVLSDKINSSSTINRPRAIRLCGAMNGIGFESEPMLRETLRDADPLTRVAAAFELWRTDSVEDVRPLIESFRPALANSDPSVRRRALETLLQMTTDIYGDENDDDNEDGEHEALGEVRVIDGIPSWYLARPIPMASSLLVSSADQQINELADRKLYCELFSRVDVESYYPPNDETFEDPASAAICNLLGQWMREASLASKALSAMGPDRLAPSDQKDLIEHWAQLVQTTGDNHANLVSCIGRLKNPQSFQWLVNWVEHGPTDELRRLSAEQICWFDQADSATEVMLDAILSGSGELAEFACRFFNNVEVDRPEIAESLISYFVEDRRAQDGKRVRPLLVSTISYLSVQREKAAEALVVIGCQDRDADVRESAANAFADRFRDERFIQYGELILKSRDDDALLGFLTPFAERHELPDPLADLVEPLLEHDDYRIRAKCVRALGRTAAATERQRLVAKRLRDEHPDVRGEALWWEYEGIPRNEYMPALIEMVNCHKPDRFAWSQIKRTGRNDQIIAAAKFGLSKGDSELVVEICDWVTEQKDEAVALKEAVELRLDAQPMPVVVQLSLLKALWSISPANAKRILEELGPVTDHRFPSIAAAAQELSNEIARAQ